MLIPPTTDQPISTVPFIAECLEYVSILAVPHAFLFYLILIYQAFTLIPCRREIKELKISVTSDTR